MSQEFIQHLPEEYRAQAEAYIAELEQAAQVATSEQQDKVVQQAQASKLEAVGQLAAGIAHEINTPIQFVSDNTRFLQEAFEDLQKLLNTYAELAEACEAGSVADEILQSIRDCAEAVDPDYLAEEVPGALSQSLEGLNRVAKIVRAMKDFSHPGGDDKQLADLNAAIESTITVARNEWKYVAELVTDLDGALPEVPCYPGDLNQVFLNMIVNAAHAIGDVVDGDGRKLGTISIATKVDGDWVEIRIADTGSGIPEEIQTRIFEPFFTTKDVGKGTGQGLAIAHNVVVDKHCGTLTLESEVGKGTAFIIRLPLHPEDTVSCGENIDEEANSVCG